MQMMPNFNSHSENLHIGSTKKSLSKQVKKGGKSDSSSFSFPKKLRANSKMSERLQIFFNHLEHTQNMSKKTVENYTHRLGRLAEYLGDPAINQLRMADILAFRMSLADSGLSKKTVNYHAIALRSFLKFLLKNDIECLAPEKIELAKIPQREVNFLQEDEIRDLLNAPLYAEENELRRARDMLMLAMLA